MKSILAVSLSLILFAFALASGRSVNAGYNSYSKSYSYTTNSKTYEYNRYQKKKHCIWRPGKGYGDKNHCHYGSPGQH